MEKDEYGEIKRKVGRAERQVGRLSLILEEAEETTNHLDGICPIVIVDTIS